VKNGIHELLTKYLQGEADQDERIKARLWINQNSDNKKYFDELKDIWEASRIVSSTQLFDIQKSLANTKFKIASKLNLQYSDGKIKLLKELLKIAAVFILAFIIGGIIFNWYNVPKDLISQKTYTIIEVPLGSKSKVTLPDGSIVWINAGSSIKYVTNSFISKRDIYLEGEAFFEIKKNNQNQFSVITSDINITALGTSFNVKAYKDEDEIETTLVKGKVSIEKRDESGKSKQIAILSPNQKAIYIKSENKLDLNTGNKITKNKQVIKPLKLKEKIIIKHNINTELSTSWKDNRWIFKDENLKSLASKIERRYDVTIIFEDKSLHDYMFSGTLENETLEQLLQVIRLTAPIDYSVIHREVYIRENMLLKKQYKKVLN